MDGYRIRKSGANRNSKTSTAGRCVSCRQIWAVCDCRKARERQRSQSASSGTFSMSHSSPETIETKGTTPGDMRQAAGALEPLPADITMAFFSFVGDSPSPITDVFSQSFLKTYLDTSIPVRAIVTTIGRIRLEFMKPGDLRSRQAAAAAIAAGDRPKLKTFLDILTAPDFHDQHITLSFGILLAYSEVMVGHSWLLFQSTIRKLSDKVQQQLKRPRRTPMLYFDRGLLMNFALMASYYCLVSFEDTFLVDVDLYDPSPFMDIDSITSQVRINAAVLHHYCKYVAEFARLHHRATKWVRQARRVVADCQITSRKTEDELRRALEDCGLLQTGKIIIESSGRTVDVMEMFRSRGDEIDDEGCEFGVLREAFYHYALMGLTRTFWDPTWKIVDEHLPHMEDMPNLEAHGLYVLEKLEQRVPTLGLEAWSHLVILMGVALEVRRPEYQERVTVLMTGIIENGFACAESMLGDMKLIWGMDYASQHDSGIGPSC